jgi:predicted ATP-grasp superfamily ATP-dependent carboligase
VQELIPGEDSRLYYVCGYFNADGQLEAAVAGQKVRITPIHSGSASFVESVRDDRLLDAARTLLAPLGYKGLFGVELKLDPRDGVYKVIEVNARWGLWDGLARRCGIDLGFLAYAREVGLPYEVDRDYRAGVKWLSFNLDLDAFLAYRKEHLLSLWAWLGSLRGETEYAVFAWDDLGPAVAEARSMAREKSRGLWSRLRRGAGSSAAAPRVDQRDRTNAAFPRC